MKVPTELVGAHVSRTAFDQQVRISFTACDSGAGRRLDAELVIETDFTLSDTAGGRHALEPGSGTALAPVLGLFTATVTGVGVEGRGKLILDFDQGSRLTVAPHPGFESWNLTGEGVTPVLVGPGGEAHWHR
ncbi:DUF6188 family protein [Streptomyces ovatisporus]|uniref:DUF6188 family protein n=1 Tax=Streptomyces ovatisporus TaxID=1128682 RepID=A0ABV9A6Y2_9ACTN